MYILHIVFDSACCPDPYVPCIAQDTFTQGGIIPYDHDPSSSETGHQMALHEAPQVGSTVLIEPCPQKGKRMYSFGATLVLGEYWRSSCPHLLYCYGGEQLAGNLFMIREILLIKILKWAANLRKLLPCFHSLKKCR